jgi:hypothetical protein
MRGVPTEGGAPPMGLFQRLVRKGLGAENVDGARSSSPSCAPRQGESGHWEQKVSLL